MANFKIPDWALPILEIEDETELANFIEARIPNWFVDVIDNYSEDYPQFEENWQLMCKHLPDSPSMKKIISGWTLIKLYPLLIYIWMIATIVAVLSSHVVGSWLFWFI